jgi:hypothetical protein
MPIFAPFAKVFAPFASNLSRKGAEFLAKHAKNHVCNLTDH